MRIHLKYHWYHRTTETFREKWANEKYQRVELIIIDRLCDALKIPFFVRHCLVPIYWTIIVIYRKIGEIHKTRKTTQMKTIKFYVSVAALRIGGLSITTNTLAAHLFICFHWKNRWKTKYARSFTKHATIIIIIILAFFPLSLSPSRCFLLHALSLLLQTEIGIHSYARRYFMHECACVCTMRWHDWRRKFFFLFLRRFCKCAVDVWCSISSHNLMTLDIVIVRLIVQYMFVAMDAFHQFGKQHTKISENEMKKKIVFDLPTLRQMNKFSPDERILLAGFGQLKYFLFFVCFGLRRVKRISLKWTIANASASLPHLISLKFKRNEIDRIERMREKLNEKYRIPPLTHHHVGHHTPHDEIKRPMTVYCLAENGRYRPGWWADWNVWMFDIDV